MIVASILMTFTVPEHIGTTPASVLWLLPLAAAISIVYKATKIRDIELGSFSRQCAVLFGTIVVIMFIAALVLLGAAWLINA